MSNDATMVANMKQERQRGNDIGATTRRVADNVRALRRHRGMTLDDLALGLEMVGWPIGKPALSKLENHKRRIDVDDLASLAAAFSVPPSRLLSEYRSEVLGLLEAEIVGSPVGESEIRRLDRLYELPEQLQALLDSLDD